VAVSFDAVQDLVLRMISSGEGSAPLGVKVAFIVTDRPPFIGDLVEELAQIVLTVIGNFNTNSLPKRHRPEAVHPAARVDGDHGGVDESQTIKAIGEEVAERTLDGRCGGIIVRYAQGKLPQKDRVHGDPDVTDGAGPLEISDGHSIARGNADTWPDLPPHTQFVGRRCAVLVIPRGGQRATPYRPGGILCRDRTRLRMRDCCDSVEVTR
jgi:hypothetical protein